MPFKTSDVDFHQFLDGSWTGVSFLFLTISKILSMIQNETKEKKNVYIYPPELLGYGISLPLPLDCQKLNHIR
jgi:hypothetical protein